MHGMLGMQAIAIYRLRMLLSICMDGYMYVGMYIDILTDVDVLQLAVSCLCSVYRVALCTV